MKNKMISALLIGAMAVPWQQAVDRMIPTMQAELPQEQSRQLRLKHDTSKNIK